MITREMVEVATIAGLTFIGDGNEEQVRKELSEVGNQAKEMFEAAIKAVYPLILKEAATVCSDKWLEYASEGQDNVAFGCSVCEKEIRNLKDKTDG